MRLLCFLWFLLLLFRRHQFPEKSRRARMKFSSLSTALATTALAASCSRRGIQGCRASSIFGVQLGSVIGEELNDLVPSPACGAVERRLAAPGFGRVDFAAALDQEDREPSPIFPARLPSGIGRGCRDHGIPVRQPP